MQLTHRLPPLNALRAFEAAARHLSFTKAADELAVTQAAISHQVKSLEDFLGTRLFNRVNRGLVLTDDGQAYWPELRDAFDGIDQATLRLRANDSSGTLTVSVLSSFAARWLVPRLGRFASYSPTSTYWWHPKTSSSTFSARMSMSEFDMVAVSTQAFALIRYSRRRSFQSAVLHCVTGQSPSLIRLI